MRPSIFWEPIRALVRLYQPMEHRRGRAMVMAAGLAAWSPSAMACGLSGKGAVSMVAVTHALLIVFGMSLVAVLSMRAASQAFGRMRQHRGGLGLAIAHVAATLVYALSIASVIVSGGLLLAMFLVM